MRFVSQQPTQSYALWGAAIKGIFKRNRTPLDASFNTTFTHSTKKIGSGVLKEILLRLTREQQLLIRLQAYAGERIAVLARLTPISEYEDYDERYTLIHVRATDTKARNEHVCIIPKEIADELREYCRATQRSVPFPNYETLWREIRQTALEQFNVRLTSHYLRKRFHTIAGKTPMPINSWDYLMGDKQTAGHNANTYTLEDFTSLVNEYDRYLRPYLSITQPKEPDEPQEPTQLLELDNVRNEN
jgi:integrase